MIALPAYIIVSEGRKKKTKKKREKECWARVIARADGMHGWQGWWLFLYHKAQGQGLVYRLLLAHPCTEDKPKLD